MSDRTQTRFRAPRPYTLGDVQFEFINLPVTVLESPSLVKGEYVAEFPTEMAHQVETRIIGMGDRFARSRLGALCELEKYRHMTPKERIQNIWAMQKFLRAMASSQWMIW